MSIRARLTLLYGLLFFVAGLMLAPFLRRPGIVLFRHTRLERP